MVSGTHDLLRLWAYGPGRDACVIVRGEDMQLRRAVELMLETVGGKAADKSADSGDGAAAEKGAGKAKE